MSTNFDPNLTTKQHIVVSGVGKLTVKLYFGQATSYSKKKKASF